MEVGRLENNFGPVCLLHAFKSSRKIDCQRRRSFRERCDKQNDWDQLKRFSNSAFRLLYLR